MGVQQAGQDRQQAGAEGWDRLGDALDERLAESDALLASRFPGETGRRQPVHTVYVPADRISRGIARDWGEQAARSVETFAPDTAALADATGIDRQAVEECLPRVLAKLRDEPVEDLRIDLEDGYGARPDAEEDAHLLAAAEALAADQAAGAAPPYWGIRFKGMEAAGRRRGLRSLGMFVQAVLEHAGELPDGFTLTLPKITSVDQVEAMVWVAERLEERFGLTAGRLGFELQIETPQSVMDPDGAAAVARMLHVGDGRVTALHYGTYDYSAACGVTAAFQSMAHPVADHAKAVMQLAAAGTGVWLSDGATNIVPVGTPAEVHAAWRLHAGLVRRSLERAYYQGWDMHPHQLVTRYLATYAFYREAFAPAAARLRAYLGAVEGGVMDEPATAQALAAVLARGVQCGALGADEVAEATGASTEEITGFAHRRVGQDG
ncbi:HpcH/HpaI aldolase/citrate lyase family protein [Murinocardiopsis flavida]|uniref:HpcH/HpaI aldolase/citrate lyase family protein n=1 Tax=Murinocardiopsis flavida TaxID=645275 RepID=A0A2P8DUN9_9ACTN|nr:aldolase [Murinocardiopsis flavida]PSL00939.1 HpcH/HpaI aldolase/citrate lyase family protein [Murinocardiopsis flavida]